MSSKSGSPSGYTNVDKIGNEDLFPEEGYAFPPQNQARQTKSYRSSITFPFNQQIKSRAEMNTSKSQPLPPPAPFQDPPLYLGRSNRRRMILDATFKTRAQQVRYKEMLAEHALEQPDQLTTLQTEELRLVDEELEAERVQRRQTQRDLSDVYQTQLASVEQRKEREHEDDLRFEASLREMDQKIAEEEAEKAEKLRLLRREMREDYNRKNAALLQARATRIAGEKEEEKRLQFEAAEIQQRRDERAVEDERRRLEKTQIRARVCEAQAKALSQAQVKQESEQQAAESETSKAAHQRLLQERQKYRQMERERHDDWIQLQKEKAAQRVDYIERPFPRKQENLENEFDEEADKLRRAKKTQAYQLTQMQERREQERKDKEDSLARDRDMLATTDQQRDASIQRLQSLVPPQLEIDVPKLLQHR
jgi:hypothetical protein